MKKMLMVCLALLVIFSGSVLGADDEGFAGWSALRAKAAYDATKNLEALYPDIKTYRSGPQITRLYGTTFGNGSSPADVAEQFRSDYSAIYGISASDLEPGSLHDKSLLSVPVMYDKTTDSYKFTLVYYSQYLEGIPVYGSELRLLVRNEPGYPLVLAISTLRNVDNFEADHSRVGSYSIVAERAAQAAQPGLTEFTEQSTVIYAGSADELADPHTAVLFEGSSDFPERYKFVVDAATGEILREENMVIFEDVVGSVSGNATEGPKEMHCAPEVLTAFPYAYVWIPGGGSAYADGNGDFTIANGGTSPVSVVSPIRGTYFRVYNAAGTDVQDTLVVTPPGPANFLHNNLNTSEQVRAQMNGYTNANEVRDWTLSYNPLYPTISSQTNFPVNVNRSDGYCPGNAWYDGNSINFCFSSSSYGNTSFASVSQHEYGHHLVATAGSGQDQYGEGMSDCVSALIADDPGLGYGFYLNDCNNPLRTADNNYQYPCVGEIHDCGNLISGCIWSTRNELLVTEPINYLEILSNLTVNSILLHTGGLITPQITIDYLTLDDNDGNIANGTPHYYEIAVGFGAHNMDAPELALAQFSYPTGRPELLNPNVPTTFEVIVTGQAGGVPIAGTGLVHYAINGGSWTEVLMSELSDNHYVAALPGTDCFAGVTYYFSVDVEGGMTMFDGGPSSPFGAIVATSAEIVFEDDFNTNTGWVVSGSVSDGAWTRGIPVGGGDRGDPPTDFDGSGWCYVTDNADDNSDVDDGTTILTSPVLDLSGGGNAAIHYARWYSNNNGAEPNSDSMMIRISNDNGASWTVVEKIGPVAQSGGGWYENTFFVADFVTPTAEVKMRFEASDYVNQGSVVEAGVDDFSVIGYLCQTGPLAIETSSLPDWTAGHAMNQQLVASGGLGTRTWTDKFSQLFGSGLSLSASGILNGTPSEGSIAFTAEVTDEAEGIDEMAYSFVVNPAIAITPQTLPDWTEAVPYSQQLTATGGTGALVWSDKNGDLAAYDLLLSSSGEVTGTATTPGSVSFVGLVTDDAGATSEDTYAFIINPVLQITTSSMPDATQWTAYSVQLEATGGTAPLVFTDKNGDLATNGLTMSSDGLITGAPSTAGTVSFIVRVDEGAGSFDEQSLSIEVAQAWLCGDVNDNGAVAIDDVTYIVDYLFGGGPEPVYMEAADMNNSGGLPDVSDLTHLVDYLFAGGPAPNCG